MVDQMRYCQKPSKTNLVYENNPALFSDQIALNRRYGASRQHLPMQRGNSVE